MRKAMTYILSAAMMLMISVPALAATAQNAADDEQTAAQVLYDLGLFKGTDKGFELDRALNRAEGAVMLTRFLGGEQEAMTGKYISPFTDLDNWVKPYLGWLYENGLAKGTAAAAYSPGQDMLYGHFILLMGRSLDIYDDNEIASNGFDTLDMDEYQKNKDRVITRGEAVYIAQRILDAEFEEGGKTLAAKLTENGVLTPELLDKVVTPVYGSEYSSVYEYENVEDGRLYNDMMTREVYGVIAAKSEIPIYATFEHKPVPEENAAVFVESDSVMYALDPITLKHTKLISIDDENQYWGVVSMFPDAACVLMNGKNGMGTLYVYKDSRLVPAIENCPLRERTANRRDMPCWDSETIGGNEIVCGMFGIISFNNSGELKLLKDIVAESVYCKNGDIYYVPQITDEQAMQIAVLSKSWFDRGGLEIWRFAENGEDEKIFTLDGLKYGMMIEKVLSLEGDKISFSSASTRQTGKVRFETMGYVYDVQSGVPSLSDIYVVFSYDGSEFSSDENMEKMRQEELDRLTEIVKNAS